VNSSDDVLGQLERLQRLLESGVLTQAEFDLQKQSLLSASSQPVRDAGRCAGCGAPLKVSPDGRCVYCGTVAPADAPPAAVQGSLAEMAGTIWAAHPDKKIQAIKELRERTGLGLKEAKDAIDEAALRANSSGRYR